MFGKWAKENQELAKTAYEHCRFEIARWKERPRREFILTGPHGNGLRNLPPEFRDLEPITTLSLNAADLGDLSFLKFVPKSDRADPNHRRRCNAEASSQAEPSHHRSPYRGRLGQTCSAFRSLASASLGTSVQRRSVC